MVVKKLFILGAGASFSATRPENAELRDMEAEDYVPAPDQTPLDGNFVRALTGMEKQLLKGYWIEDRVWIEEALGKLKENWLNPEPWEGKGLEEAIQYQAANMVFVQKIIGNRKLYTLSFDEYLDTLVHLIALRLRIEKRPWAKKTGELSVYEEFAQKHFSSTNTKNRIITVNYDDALDDFLLGLHNYDLGKIYFPALKKLKGGRASSQDKKIGTPLLLKLHGSVNWNCLTGNYRRVFREGSDVKNRADRFNLNNIWFRGDGSPIEHDADSPCIIPPIASKPVAKIKIFRELWKLASRYLKECEELYFCGYSLPPTDTMAAALFGNFRNSKMRKIVVVDREAAVIDRLTKLIQKDNMPNADWEYHKDFGEFVRKS